MLWLLTLKNSYGAVSVGTLRRPQRCSIVTATSYAE
jgi:hypothetical protein